jgi:uncharacterized membrane protein
MALAGAPSLAAVTFEVTDLGAVPGTVNALWSFGARATGIDNDGNIIGTFASVASGGEGAAFSWSPGANAPTPLPGLGSANFTGGINNHGVAVGYSFGLASDPVNNHGVLWLNGAVHDLVAFGLPVGATVGGVNDAGQMAGTLADGSAFLWKPGSVLTNLGRLGSTSADVFALNDSGQIAGTLEGPFGTPRVAFVRQASGIVTRLDPLFGPTDTHDVTAFGLNNLGQVVGMEGYGPVLWTPGMGPVDLLSRARGGQRFSAYAINDFGQIAGSVVVSNGDSPHAAVMTPTGTLNWTGAHGNAFNDGLNWDSGLGYAPSKFLDVLLAPSSPVTVVTAADSQAKSLTLGDGGAGLGRLIVSAGTTLAVAQGVTLSSGELMIASGGRLQAGSLTQTAGLLTVDGTLDTFGGDVLITGGTLNGNGNINTGVTLPNGSVSNGSFVVGGGPGFAFFRPGHSPGSFTVNGELTMASNGEMELQVERLADGTLAWDHVSASSISFLTGSRIHFSVGPGVASASAQSLDFLSCGSGCSFGADVAFIVDGAPGATFSVGAAGLQLTIAAVPEPSQALLWLAGLGAGVGFMRRRQVRDSALRE